MNTEQRSELTCHLMKHSRCCDSGCIEWVKSVTSAGYGQLNNRKLGGHYYTHRLAYELFVGPITNGLWVLHSCDNRRCINPDHLFLGTHDDNMADMRSKGRSEKIGEDNPASKLTADEVMTIRWLSSLSMFSQRRIGRWFGVSQPCVSAVVHNFRWNHI